MGIRGKWWRWVRGRLRRGVGNDFEVLGGFVGVDNVLIVIP